MGVLLVGHTLGNVSGGLHGTLFEYTFLILNIESIQQTITVQLVLFNIIAYVLNSLSNES